MSDLLCYSAADISFEQPTYAVMENIASDNRALRVCFDYTGLSSEMTVTLKTLSTTAQGIVATNKQWLFDIML